MKIDKTKPIYGTMFGDSCYGEKKKVVFIKPEELKYTDYNGRPSMIFIWGWPGPDYNVYYEKDYGDTWAYCLEDFYAEVKYDGEI